MAATSHALATVAGSLPEELRGSLVGVGLDVVEVAGIAHNTSIGGDRWLRKVFTDGERHYADGDAERLATRFAAKEAVAKALGTGFRDGISPTTIEIVCDTAGTPTVVLHGAAARAAGALGVGRVLVSLTRDGGIAAAAAWALAND
jgi:holo-[acyl-carrier protein] synthase